MLSIIFILFIIIFTFFILKKKNNNLYNKKKIKKKLDISSFKFFNNEYHVLFKINPNAKVNVYNIDKDINVITIDNFLSNIDELSNDNVINKISGQFAPDDPEHPYPGNQYPVVLENSNEVAFKIKKLIGNNLKNFSETNTENSDLVFSIGKKFKTENIFTTTPHTDSNNRYNYALMLYLNKPDDCYGGTGIYKSKIINYVVPYKNKKMLNNDEFYSLYSKSDVIKDSNDKWELIHLLKMKYNRLVIYESCLFHSIYLDSFDLFKKYRYTFNFWYDNPNDPEFK